QPEPECQELCPALADPSLNFSTMNYEWESDKNFMSHDVAL
ncbi:23452_t:CDS:1, partial [Gigaspora rosea]